MLAHYGINTQIHVTITTQLHFYYNSYALQNTSIAAPKISKNTFLTSTNDNIQLQNHEGSENEACTIKILTDQAKYKQSERYRIEASTSSSLLYGDERERRSPLPEIIRSSYPHLG